MIHHEREAHRLELRLRVGAHAQDVVTSRANWKIHGHVVFLDTVERDPAVAEFLRVVADLKQVEGKLRHRPRRLGRVEHFHGVNGEAARVFVAGARRAGEGIEQPEGNLVRARDQPCFDFVHRRRFLRAGYREGLHDVAVHAHLHLRRFLAGDALGGENAEAMLAGLERRESQRGRAFGDEPHRARRADVSLDRAFEQAGFKLGAANAHGRWSHDDLVHDLLRRGEILLQQHRRHRKHIADVVEAVAGIIRREIRRRLEIHAHQVADGVVVFHAIEPANRDAAGIGVLAVHREECVFDKLREALALGERRLLARRWRHLTLADVREHLFPSLPVLVQRGFARERVEREVALLLPAAVATVAILLEQRRDVLLIGELGG